MDNKTVMISIVLLFVVGLVALNLERFTGKATAHSVPPKVYLSASSKINSQENCVVSAGNKLYITAETGSKGIRRKGSVYRSEGLKAAEVEFDQNCGGGMCRPNRVTWASYRIPAEWKGRYCFRVIESGSNEVVGKCFTVVQ